jgi:hypothetical protein
MCFLWIAPRFLLAETRRTLAALVGASIVAAAVAGLIFAAYIDSPTSAHLASCIFAGSCLSLVGILIPVDTGVAWALRTAAAAIESPSRHALERAARAHRQATRLPSLTSKRSQWRALVRLADQRAGLRTLDGAEADEARRDLDARIETLAAELAPVAEPSKAAKTEPPVTVETAPVEPEPAPPDESEATITVETEPPQGEGDLAR